MSIAGQQQTAHLVWRGQTEPPTSILLSHEPLEKLLPTQDLRWGHNKSSPWPTLPTVICQFWEKKNKQYWEMADGKSVTVPTAPTCYLLFLRRSTMHLLICAIHSCFSVDVAAYTANDLDAVRISHPFRNSENRTVSLLGIKQRQIMKLKLV